MPAGQIHLWMLSVEERVGQSHKNPGSVAALLRGNFGSLMDFAETLHILTCFFELFPQNFVIFGFPKKFPSWKMSTKIYIVEKVLQKTGFF